MLAGDAMQALAFEVLTPARDHGEPWRPRCRPACALLARAAGPRRHGRRPGHRPGRIGRPLTEARCATCTAARPARCCKASVLMGAACGHTDARRLGGAERLRRRARAGLPGGRRHPRRDAGRRTRWARPPARTGRQQADLRHRAGPGAPPAPCAARLRDAGPRGAGRRSGLPTPATCACWPTGGRPRQLTCQDMPIPAPTIDSPADLRRCRVASWQLAGELRDYVLTASVQTGGHLSATSARWS
jgi:hypothetical protein